MSAAQMCHLWVVKFLGAWQTCEKRLLASLCPSVCVSALNNSNLTGRVLIKFDIWGFKKVYREG
jgi:hypothetical protein